MAKDITKKVTKTDQVSVGEELSIPYFPNKPTTIFIGFFPEDSDLEEQDTESGNRLRTQLVDDEGSVGVEVARRAVKLKITDRKIVLTNLNDHTISYGTEINKPTQLQPNKSISIVNNTETTRDFWFSLGKRLILKSGKTEGNKRSLKTLLLEAI